MPPRGVTNPKRKRQYEHVKESELERGVGEDRAEEIAARTVNKQRAQSGETKAARAGRKTSGGKKKTSRGKKASGRKNASGRKESAGKKAATRTSASTRKAPARRRKAAAKKR
jgi:hypothetical protein